MSEREERVARNEAISREINEGIERAVGSREGYVRMTCECGLSDCQALVAISIGEYEVLRSDPRRFAVVRDHVMADVEEAVSVTDRFVVVQKREGTPAEVSEDLDPRG
jgi:hypothetical protein